MTTKLPEVLAYLYPGIDFMQECRLQDDGTGPYIAFWSRSEPQPTQEEINAAELPAQIAIERAAIKPINATQIRIALNQLGLRNRVEEAVAAGSQDLKDWWEFSVNLYRDHPLVVSMAVALGLPPEQVDALWLVAAAIE